MSMLLTMSYNVYDRDKEKNVCSAQVIFTRVRNNYLLITETSRVINVSLASVIDQSEP